MLSFRGNVFHLNRFDGVSHHPILAPASGNGRFGPDRRLKYLITCVVQNSDMPVIELGVSIAIWVAINFAFAIAPLSSGQSSPNESFCLRPFLTSKKCGMVTSD